MRRYNKARVKNFTESEMQRLEELSKQKDALKSQIKPIQDEIRKINQAEFSRYCCKQRRNRRGDEFAKNTRVYKLFGKRYKELTPEEKREYCRIGQRKYRKNKET